MGIPNISDMIVFDGLQFDNDDWDANANQTVNFVANGLFDLIVNSVTANNGFDAQGAKIVNVGDGTDPGDAVNFSQLSTLGVPSNYIIGLIPSNGTDTVKDIDFLTGICKDSTNVLSLESTSAFTKQIDANWALGTDQGGFPSALTLSIDTWYHLFIIGKTDGSVDFGFDTDLSATNLLSDATGFTLFRRVGSVLTDGSSNIIQFIAMESAGGKLDVWYKFGVNSFGISEVTFGNSASATIAISAPLGFKNIVRLQAFLANSSGNIKVISIDEQLQSQVSVSGFEYTELPTDVLSQISYSSTSGATGSNTINTMGYIDARLS